MNSLVGIPWLDGGRTRAGADCVGLVQIGLVERFGVVLEVPKPGADYDAAKDGVERFVAEMRPVAAPGDVVFFRSRKTGKIQHVALHLGDARLLHTLRCYQSRIDVGPRLLERMALEMVGALPSSDVVRLGQALRDPQLGWVNIALFALSLALSFASSFLMPKPDLGKFRNQRGRYGYDALITRASTELPLPDLLGDVTIAGNSPHTSIQDHALTVTSQAEQKANRVVILAAGPIQGIELGNFEITVNGYQIDNAYWFDGTAIGFALNPAQTKAEAVTGTIRSDTLRPSVTLYSGAHAISVPVDVRAGYDREFPVYGFNGCCYMVFRLINSAKFSSFNLNVTVKGRLCRTFDASGFLRTTVSGESLAGADGSKVRFKLAFDDIEGLSAITVNGTSYAELSASAQTGNKYWLNKTKGYVEFITAPSAAATVLVTYTYFPRLWTDNPAAHLVYLLTEPVRGRGFGESRIEWVAAAALQSYCNDTVSIRTSEGLVSQTRYTTNYAIDYKKQWEEHVQAILDACYAYLFQSNGKWVMKARREGTAVFDFDTSNILLGTFSSQTVERTAKLNLIRAFIRTAETYNAETEVPVSDTIDQRRRADAGAPNQGIAERSLQFPAVDSRPQATLLGDMLLEESQKVRWVCELTTNLQGLPLEPGDIVTVTHPSRPSWAAKEFRIEQLTSDEQDRLMLKLSEYVEEAYLI